MRFIETDLEVGPPLTELLRPTCLGDALRLWKRIPLATRKTLEHMNVGPQDKFDMLIKNWDEYVSEFPINNPINEVKLCQT